MSCVPYVITEGCGVQAGEGKGRVKFLDVPEKCGESVWSGYGKPKV